VVYASQNWWLTGFLRPGDWADANTYLCAARYGVAAGNVGWTHPKLAFHQYTDAAQPFATDRSIMLAGFSLDQFTIGKQGQGQGDEHMFWFIGKQGADDIALLYPNGDFVGVFGSNWSDVTRVNGVPKLDVPPEVWDDMRTRFGGYAPGAAQHFADAFKDALAGVLNVQVTVQTPDGQSLAGHLEPVDGDAIHLRWVPDTAPAGQ